MGKYKGILLLTDFDGTLYTGREIPQNNIDAIKRFCAEGGLFGFSSGRTYRYFDEWEHLVKANTFISSVNGTVIYDYPNRRVVSEKFIKDGSYGKIAELCSGHDRYLNVIVFTQDDVAYVDLPSQEGVSGALREMMSKPVYKVMFHSRYAISDDEKAEIARFLGEDYYVSRSWREGIEIQSSDSTKGAAARQIKALTGADLLVCAGDFENDETMISAADIGYAVANATPEIKAIADRHTVSVGEGAIAAIIDELGSL